MEAETTTTTTSETSHKLEMDTLIYWEISKAYNGKGKSVTVKTAIQCLQEIAFQIKPRNKVMSLSEQLLDDVIAYGSKNSKIKSQSK